MTTTQENRGKTFKKAAAVVLLAAAIVGGGGATAATAGWGHSVGNQAFWYRY